MTDEFIFASEEETPSPNLELGRHKYKKWKIAVIDDEESVHKVTKMALSNFEFEGRGIEFIHGYSGADAQKIFREHRDIALVLLDVVMEAEHSGLDVVRYVREELQNDKTRIVLRTGQPGQAPEKEVIGQYDINDYKEKTELTSRKLFTLLYSCLRSYRDIIALDESRKGLEQVIRSSKHIFENKFIDEFAAGVLKQITSILHLDDDAFFGQLNGLAAQEKDNDYKIVAGTGIYSHCVGRSAKEFLPDSFTVQLKENTRHPEGYTVGDNYMAASTGQAGQKNILYLTGISQRNPLDKHLLKLFCDNVLIAFDNLYLKDQLIATQRELVYRLGEAVETRSQETGNHVKRVAAISKIIALKSGLSEQEAEVLMHASPLHDLGKIGIPDAILNKPASLDEAEWHVMQTHTKIGFDLLGHSERQVLKTGGLISLQHHEKWDGSGYPQGLKGEEIDICARITSLADVYDALSSERVYKEAWPKEKVLNYIRKNSGIHFDPRLVDIFFKHLTEIEDIKKNFSDSHSGGGI